MPPLRHFANKKRPVLIDADVLVWTGGYLGEDHIVWPGGEDEEPTVLSSEATVVDYITKELARIKQACNASDLILCLSGENNFRKDVLPSYKANRKKIEKPVLHAYARKVVERFAKKHSVVCIDKLEADDVMGMMATDGNDRIISTIDKDLNQIPGWHYNFRKKIAYYVTPEEAWRWFYIQTMTGDPTDGYKGIPGIGPAKAERAVNDTLSGTTVWSDNADVHAELWATVVSMYESKGLTEEDAYVQARVAQILRHGQYDHSVKHVADFFAVVPL